MEKSFANKTQEEVTISMFPAREKINYWRKTVSLSLKLNICVNNIFIFIFIVPQALCWFTHQVDSSSFSLFFCFDHFQNAIHSRVGTADSIIDDF